MRANKNPWIRFRDRTSDEVGVRLLSMPTRFFPARRGEAVTIPGRSGTVWVDDGADEGGQIGLQMAVDDPALMDDAAAWLSGDGLLVISDEPNRAWHASVRKSITRSSIRARLLGQTWTVMFDAQPYRYVYPEPEAVQVPGVGATLTNPSSIPALPVLTIESTGFFVVMVNNVIIQPVDEDNGYIGTVVIDSEAMEITDGEGGRAGNLISLSEFPVLEAGDNTVIRSGAISRVTITRPWRYR